MKLLKHIEGKIKKMGLLEMALVKTTVLVFGIILGAYIASFVKINLYYFLALFVLLYIATVYRVLGR